MYVYQWINKLTSRINNKKTDQIKNAKITRIESTRIDTLNNDNKLDNMRVSKL